MVSRQARTWTTDKSAIASGDDQSTGSKERKETVRVATRTPLFSDGAKEPLRCCLCGERDYDKLIVQALGVSVGPLNGYEFTFCEECWRGPMLGQELFNLLGYPNGLRLKGEFVEIREE